MYNSKTTNTYDCTWKSTGRALVKYDMAAFCLSDVNIALLSPDENLEQG